MSNFTLDPMPNLTPTDGKDDKAVRTALEVMQEHNDIKEQRDSDNQTIMDLMERGFKVVDPSGTRQISSKALQQALWRTIQRMKPLDFTIHGTGRPEFMEQFVTQGVSTVLDRGGYVKALRDKQGAFFNLLLLGDAFIQVGTNPSEYDMPIGFNTISNSNVYVDPFATVMRAESSGRSVSKMVVVFSYSWAEAVKFYPKLKKIGGAGRIPRDLTFDKETARSQQQTTQIKEKTDLVEIAHFYDIANKNYTVFAGPSCTVLEKKSGDKYPFVKGKKPYIPVIHMICQPASEGFYNHGIGDMIYDLAVLSQRLLNMEINHVNDNTYPIELVNLPKDKSAKFFNDLMAAHEMRAAGKKGFVPVEYDANSPGSSQISSQTLLTNNLTNEWQLIFEQLTREISRLGINLDEADRGANVTATQILSEEEAANSFVKQVMEYNASETKFSIELTMDMIEEFIGKKNKTKLNLTTLIDVDGVELPLDEATLGNLSSELKEGDYFVKVNARTGAVPSNILQQAQISRILPLTPPGTPAFAKLQKQLADLNDRDLSMEDFALIQQAPQIAEEAIEGATEPGLADTERARINPRITEPEPAL
tara:strand:- start:6496 stop:8268 length:1773 start_codon:yes stop_codon:yes gene_type:complete